MYTFLKKYKKYILLFIPTLKIPSVISSSLLIKIKSLFKRLKPGVVLDIGGREAPYKKFVPHTKYLILDIDESIHPDILSDAHEIRWESGYFDVVISIDTIEHVREPQKVVDEVHRILKEKGICIVAVPLLYPYHPGPEDHYRFTPDSLKQIFGKFRRVEIYHYGNRLQVLFQFINHRSQETFFQAAVTGLVAAFLNILNPVIARIHFQKTKFPFGFVVYAEK